MEELLEGKLITRLTEEQNINFIKKLDNTFKSDQQKLMASMLYDYLNYENSDDFVVDLNDVWKLLGFRQLNDAKEILDKNYTIGRDYKKEHVRQPSYNYDKIFEEPILLTVDCFKRLCSNSPSEEFKDTYKEMIDLLNEVENDEKDT